MSKSKFEMNAKFQKKIKKLSRKHPPSLAHLRWAGYGAAGERSKTRMIMKRRQESGVRSQNKSD